MAKNTKQRLLFPLVFGYFQGGTGCSPQESSQLRSWPFAAGHRSPGSSRSTLAGTECICWCWGSGRKQDSSELGIFQYKYQLRRN